MVENEEQRKRDLKDYEDSLDIHINRLVDERIKRLLDGDDDHHKRTHLVWDENVLPYLEDQARRTRNSDYRIKLIKNALLWVFVFGGAGYILSLAADGFA